MIFSRSEARQPTAVPIMRRVLMIGVLALIAALPAAARQLVIQHFDDRVVVNPDGTIEVTELIDVQFIGAWHGIYRTIPVQYDGPGGLNYTLFVQMLGVTDDNGQSLKYNQSRDGRNMRLQIFVPGAEDATRTVIIRYRALDALRFFPDHAELYWNVTGEEWDATIQSASAHIEFPAGVTGLHAIAYTGAFGARMEDAHVVTTGNVVEVQTAPPLSYHEGLTVVAGFDKGFVHPPSADAKIALFLRSNWPLFIPAIVFLVMFWLWWTRGRDPEHGAVVVQYEPPDKLTPGECGTLLDNEASMRDITATLVDLAVQGYLTIEQKDESKMLGLMHSQDYIFHLKKPMAEWANARAHEQEMLAALFEDGAVSDIRLSELQNRFYTHLPAIRDRIFDALVEDGYYLHRPDTVHQAYLGMGLLIGFLMLSFSNGLENATGIASLTWTITGIASGAVICIFGWFMPARTLAGWRILEKVLGFENFLGRVEKDQIERLEKTPELFEKYLPYAMALHVEKKWVQAFSGITMQPPQWYQGAYAGAFQPFFLMNALSVMSSQATSVMASSPRSSSGGSGFGGFGGAGGGFGGGGGGGF